MGQMHGQETCLVSRSLWPVVVFGGFIGDRGQAPEAVLFAVPVAGDFDQDHDRDLDLLMGGPGVLVEYVLL